MECITGDEDVPFLGDEVRMLERVHLDDGVGLGGVRRRWKRLQVSGLTKIKVMEAAPKTQASQFQYPAKKPTTRPYLGPGVTEAH